VGGIVNTAPLLAGGTLYVGAADRVLYMLAAATGAVVATDTLPGRVKATPAPCGEYLVVLAENRTIVVYRGRP
jgi:outer membrane protein assembly factor BamB